MRLPGLAVDQGGMAKLLGQTGAWRGALGSPVQRVRHFRAEQAGWT